MSSTKYCILGRFIAGLRSFMYVRKSSGPYNDPWGTPQINVDIFELKPLIQARNQNIYRAGEVCGIRALINFQKTAG